MTKEFDKPESEMDFEKLMLPSKPIKVGETWKVDVGPLVKEIMKEAPFNFDQAKCTVTGKLTKAYQKDGKTFGAIEFKLDLPILSFGEAPKMLAFKEGAKMSMTMNLDVCIDGTSPNGNMSMSSLLTGTGTIKGPDGKEFSMSLEIRNSGSGRHEEQPR